jgi:hypothetical protein
VNAVIHYDSAVVRAVGVTEGDVLKKSNTQGKFDGRIDERAGTVSLNLATEGGGTAPGGGNLAVISFEVLGKGNAQIALNSLIATATGGSPVQPASTAPLQVVVP